MQNHRPKDHWQHWLADRLTDLRHQVTYPQLPDPDDPVGPGTGAGYGLWPAVLDWCLDAAAKLTPRPA